MPFLWTNGRAVVAHCAPFMIEAVSEPATSSAIAPELGSLSATFRSGALIHRPYHSGEPTWYIPVKSAYARYLELAENASLPLAQARQLAQAQVNAAYRRFVAYRAGHWAYCAIRVIVSVEGSDIGWEHAGVFAEDENTEIVNAAVLAVVPNAIEAALGTLETHRSIHDPNPLNTCKAEAWALRTQPKAVSASAPGRRSLNEMRHCDIHAMPLPATLAWRTAFHLNIASGQAYAVVYHNQGLELLTDYSGEIFTAVRELATDELLRDYYQGTSLNHARPARWALCRFLDGFEAIVLLEDVAYPVDQSATSWPRDASWWPSAQAPWTIHGWAL